LIDYERTDRHKIGGRLIACLQPAWRILLLFVVVTLPAGGQDAASQIRAEIQSVQQSLKDRPVTDPDTANLSTAIEDELKAASEAVNAGALYLGLQRLGQAMDLLQGARAVADKKAEIVKGGVPAFEAEWRKVSLVLDEHEKEVRSRDWSNVPAAVRALSET
jgi:hypothetical protein